MLIERLVTFAAAFSSGGPVSWPARQTDPEQPRVVPSAGAHPRTAAHCRCTIVTRIAIAWLASK